MVATAFAFNFYSKNIVLFLCWSVSGGRQQVSLEIFTISQVSAISYLVWYVEVHYCRSWGNFPLSLCSPFRGFHSEPKFCSHALSVDCQFNTQFCTVHPSFIHAWRHLFQCKATPQSHIISIKFPVEGELIAAGLGAPPRAHHGVHAGFLPLMRIHLSSAPEIILNAFQITS